MLAGRATAIEQSELTPWGAVGEGINGNRHGQRLGGEVGVDWIGVFDGQFRVVSRG